MEQLKQRELWADNAKFIGIFLMVLGHNPLESLSLDDFIYSFHMPLFFVLSGYFASSKKEDFSSYLKKNFRSLIVPYLFFCIIALPFNYYCLWNNRSIYPCHNEVDFILRPLLGILFVDTTSVSYFNGPMWFFIPLFTVKIMFHPFKRGYSNFPLLVCGAIFSILLYLYVPNTLFRLNSSFLVFPFYILGFMLKQYTSVVEKFKSASPFKAFLLITILLSLTFIMSTINGHVEVSGAGCGIYLWLFYINAIIGILAVMCIATKLGANKYILTIGGGTAVILGLHRYFQTALIKIVTLLTGMETFPWWLALIMTSILILIHIPIINFLNNHYPYLIGKRK